LIEKYAGQKFNLINQDVLTIDFNKIAHEYDASKLRIVGNIPYNISTPLLFHLFKASSVIKDCFIMVQHEVAARLTAKPGNKTYGRLSIMAQYFCNIDYLFEVNRVVTN